MFCAFLVSFSIRGLSWAVFSIRIVKAMKGGLEWNKCLYRSLSTEALEFIFAILVTFVFTARNGLLHLFQMP